jgi:4-amino-4-deoxy-L-arabinose transferase-like glycosyltransferase
MTEVLEPTVDSKVTPHPDADERRLRRFRPSLPTWCTAALVVAAGVWAGVGSFRLFPLLTDDADEAAYLSQSEALRAGHLFLPAPSTVRAAFQPWFSAIIDGNYIYKYTPVHSAFIAIAHTVFGTDRGLLVLVAMADVLLLALVARELGASRGAAVLGCVVFVLSPLWIVQSATFLPYAACLVLLQGFLLLALRGFRTGSRLQLVGAGLVAGIAVFARPFDGVLFVGTVMAWQLWRTRRTGTWRYVGWFLVGGLPPLVLFLAYNALATGSALQLAFHVTGSSDTLGFGARHVLPNDPEVDYTVWKAISALTNNMKLVVTWTFGSFLALVFTGIGFANRRDLKDRTLLVALLLVWPLGFFFFWGAYASVLLWDITQFVGPFYYMPMLMAIALGAGVGIARVARGRAWVVVLVVATMAGLTLVTLIPAINTNRERTAQKRLIENVVKPLERGAPKLLFLPPLYGPYLQNPFSFLRNAPDYDSQIVYAIDQGNRNFRVIDEFADRTPYVMSVPSGFGADKPASETKAFARRMRRVHASSITVEASASGSLMRNSAFLSVIFGTKVVRVPFMDDHFGGGTAKFEIAPRDGSIVLLDADAAAATTSVKTVHHELQLGIIAGTEQDAFIAYGKIFPLRSVEDGFEVLVPGSVSNDNLGIFDSASLKLTVHR